MSDFAVTEYNTNTQSPVSSQLYNTELVWLRISLTKISFASPEGPPGILVTLCWVFWVLLLSLLMLCTPVEILFTSDHSEDLVGLHVAFVWRFGRASLFPLFGVQQTLSPLLLAFFLLRCPSFPIIIHRHAQSIYYIKCISLYSDTCHTEVFDPWWNIFYVLV